MGDANPIHTLGDYSKPSHEGYRNTIKLPVGNNVVPLRSDTIRLVQNGCSFHGLRFEDPNQHLKDFLKLMDSLDLDGKIEKERACVYFNFPFAIKLVTGLNVFQQDPSPHENLSQKHGLISRTYSKNSFIMASIFGSKSKSFMTMSLPPQDEPLTNRLVEDEAKEDGNVKTSTTEYEDHEMTVESEKEFEEETEDEIEEEEENNPKHFDTFPTMKELRYYTVLTVVILLRIMVYIDA
ncbi:hypothetical protein Tco_1441507 [Tanacetum coccineum]